MNVFTIVNNFDKIAVIFFITAILCYIVLIITYNTN